MYRWYYPPSKIKWRTMPYIFITWLHNLLCASENLIWPFPTHLPLLGVFPPFHTSQHLLTAVLFSLDNPQQKGGFFSQKIHLQNWDSCLSAGWGGTGRWHHKLLQWFLSPRASRAHIPHQFSPHKPRWDLSGIPTAGYLSALHHTNTQREMEGLLFMQSQSLDSAKLWMWNTTMLCATECRVLTFFQCLP